MSEPEQLAMLTPEDEAALWLCPTCRGNRVMLRILYPSEVVAGDETCVEPCRTCYATGYLSFNPDDHSTIPF
jgi:hypothetical protein